MARASDRWLVAELRLHVPRLTTQGRDAVVEWLRERADKISSSKCGHYDFEQPERLHKLKVGR